MGVGLESKKQFSNSNITNIKRIKYLDEQITIFFNKNDNVWRNLNNAKRT